MDEKKKVTIKLYTEILKVIALLFGGTAAGLASLISRCWTSAREVFLLVTTIICVSTFGLLIQNHQKSLEINSQVVEYGAVFGLFVAVMTPLNIGIIYSIRENKRLSSKP